MVAARVSMSRVLACAPWSNTRNNSTPTRMCTVAAVRPTVEPARGQGLDAHPVAGYLTEADGDRREVGLVPDLRTQDRRVQAPGNPLGRGLRLGERLGQRVHLVDGGKAQQQRPPRHRQPRPVLSRTVHVDGDVLLTGQQCDRPGADGLVLVRHRSPHPLRWGAGHRLTGHDVPLSLVVRPGAERDPGVSRLCCQPFPRAARARSAQGAGAAVRAQRGGAGVLTRICRRSRVSDRARRGVGRREPLGRFIGPLPWSPHPPLTKSGGRRNNDDGPEPLARGKRRAQQRAPSVSDATASYSCHKEVAAPASEQRQHVHWRGRT